MLSLTALPLGALKIYNDLFLDYCIVGKALVKSGYDLRYYKKENSTLEEEFFVWYKDYLVPIEMKVKNNNSKSLSTLIKSDNYEEIRFGIKIIKGNIGFDSNIYTFPHFCTFLIKDFLASFKFEQGVLSD